MFESFEHTADVGLTVRARSLPELFAEAGRGLVALLVERPETVRTELEARVELAADRREDLLLDWLDEVLFRFTARGFVAARFAVETDGRRLAATLHGEPYDPERHRPGVEVKAVTYHGLEIRETGDGFAARVVLDI